MEPQFTGDNGTLRGWFCECGNWERAILRERRFTKETYYGDQKNKRGHLVQ
jgi:hypothetical protein